MSSLTLKLNKRSNWKITVNTHYGLEVNVEASKSASISIVKSKVCQQLEYMHPHYFGLKYSFSKSKFVGWLNETKTIKGELEKNNLSVQLAFKFYDPEPEKIPCQFIRHALYVQLRKDIVDGLLTTSESDLARLAGLCMRIENGDFKDNNEFRRNLLLYTFVPGKMNFRAQNDSEFFNEVFEAYRECRGKDTSVLELEFLNFCANLPFYGLHRFKLLDADEHPKTVGVGCDGIYLLDNGTIQNIILWCAVKTISIKNVVVSIQLVGEGSLSSRLGGGETSMAKYELRNDQLFDVYQQFKTGVVAYKSQSSDYSKKFYNFLTESYNFYQCKKPEKTKNSIDTVIDMTLYKIKSEFGPDKSRDVGPSNTKPLKRYKTSHFTYAPANQLPLRRRQRGTFFNLDSSKHRSLLTPEQLDMEFEDSQHASRMNEIQSRQKNTIKDRDARSTIMMSPDLFSRRRSCTIMPNDPTSASPLAENHSATDKTRLSLKLQPLTNGTEAQFCGSLTQPASSQQDLFNSRMQIGMSSKKESSNRRPSVLDMGYSSDSSVNNFHIESIENFKKVSDINSHLSALASSKNQSDDTIISGLKISEKNDFDNNETEILNNLMNVKPSANDFTNSEELLELLNGDSTVKEGEILGEMMTRLKNNGPPKPYDFDTSPENTEATTKWIQSIGNVTQGENSDNGRPISTTEKDHFKDLEIIDNDSTAENTVNPILAANQTNQQKTHNVTEQ